MAILERALPAAGSLAPTSERPDASLIATYGFVGLMETIGFARYFRDPVVATIGGVGMLPLAAAAIVRRVTTVTRTVVIGGGVGGLAIAIRLAAAGHEPLLVERNEVVGGKLATYTRDGYTFDIGPSVGHAATPVRRAVRTGGTTSATGSTSFGSTRSSGTTGGMVRR